MPGPGRRSTSLFLSAVLLAGLAGCASDAPTDGGRRTTTTTKQTRVRTPTVEELRQLLPRAEIIGSGWTAQEADQPTDSRLDAAMAEDCPAFNAVRHATRKPDLTATYTDDASRGVQILFDRHPRSYDDDRFEELVQEIDDCGDVVYSTDDGTRITITLQASVEDAIGDQAARLALSALIESPAIGTPAHANTYFVVFRRGPVGVTVIGTDAVDPDTGGVTRADTEIVDRLATSEDDILRQLLAD